MQVAIDNKLDIKLIKTEFLVWSLILYQAYYNFSILDISKDFPNGHSKIPESGVWETTRKD